MKQRKFKEIMHKTAQDFYEAGVMDEKIFREIDVLCLPPIKKYSPSQIKRIRQRNKVSQSVFAAYLNTTCSTIQNWEKGQKHPRGMALKLLNLVDKHGLAFVAP